MSLLLTGLLVLCSLPVQVSAATIIDSGSCGDELTWMLDDEGTLTISGTGTITDYDILDNKTPWYNNKALINNIVICNGVKNIGDYAFCDCNSLTSITIPNSITSIKSFAFDRCSNLKDVYYSGSENEWNEMNIATGNDYLLNATIHYDWQSVHEHDYVMTKTEPATCVKDGYRLYECACGDSYTEAIKATGHSFGAWVVVTPATVEKEGVEKRVCKNCEALETRAIAKLTPTAPPVIEVTQADDVKKLSNGNVAVLSDMTIAQLLTSLSSGVSLPNGATKLYTGMVIELKKDGKVVDTITLVVRGDVYGKDGLSAADARLALRQSVTLENMTGTYLEAADVNGDGKVTSADARLILRASVGLEKKLAA